MESLDELRARNAEVAREWSWLQNALHAVASARADQGDASAFRIMQVQAIAVGRRRVELSTRIKALEGPGAGP